jgi:hypothetical protein
MKSRFFRAVTGLWREIQNIDDTTTVAAAHVLSLACACEGDDALAQELSNAGYEMSKRLSLFGAQDGHVAAGFESNEMRRWRAHVAWGEYNWLRQVSTIPDQRCRLFD